MERSYRDLSRASLAGADYDDYKPVRGSGGYLDRDPPLRESYSSLSGSSYSPGRSSYSRGSSYDREIMESLLQQRALQQQLSIRESQLAMASSILQQQQQQQYFNKRRMDGSRDYRDDFKRPRLMDNRSRPRNRLSGGRESSERSRGSSGRRQNQSSPHGQGRSSDRTRTPKESYDPEKPTVDDEAGGKLRCKLCKVDCKDEEEMTAHRASSDHKEKLASFREEQRSKRYCNVCDVPLNVTFMHHQRLTFHKKRKIQVTKGCGWCKITSFKNFTEVLEHRATETHIKNQKLYEKDKSSSSRRDSRDESRSSRKREPIKVEMPPELSKFDPKVVVGQTCVVAVTGWFCKVCNKFYNNETAAKETHCLTELHFNNFKKFTYAKLKAKAEVERDAKEKAEEEERKKKEAEAAEKKEGEETTEPGEETTTKPSSEQQETDVQEEPTDTQDQQEGGEEMEVGENADGADQEEEVDAEEEAAAGVEGGENEEGDGEEMLEEPEEDYVDDEEVAAAEVGLFQPSEEGAGDPKEVEDVENPEGISQDDEPMVEEFEGEGEEEAEEESKQKKATRATVSSPGRGRGRGANRARRGRKVAK